MTVYTFALKRSFRDKTNLLFLTLFPLAAVFLPNQAYWPILPLGYHYFGVLILFVSIRLTGMMLEDRQKGVVKRLAAAPISHFRYLFENLLAFGTIIFTQCIVVIALGVVYGQELYQPLFLLFLYIIFGVTAISLSLAWNSFYHNKESSFLVFMTIIVFMALLGGMVLPIDMLPERLLRLTVIFPTYWLMEGIEWVVYGGRLSDFLFINAVLLLYAFILLTVGSIRKIS